jgi:hypothetical protein
MLDPDVSFESTLSERFDPCMRFDYETGLLCGSTVGKIRCFVKHSNIGLFCERNHQRRPEQWINHAEFLPGGRFAEANVPEHLLSRSVTKKRSTQFDPSGPARLRARRYGRCFICRRRPARSLEPRPLAIWLKANEPALHQRIRDALGVEVTAPDAGDRWSSVVPSELHSEALRLARGSQLTLDHLFPVDILVRVRERVPRRAFEDGAKNLIVPLCHEDNNARKSVVLEPIPELDRRVIGFFFGGKRALAESQPLYKSFLELMGPCDVAAEQKRRARRIAT